MYTIKISPKAAEDLMEIKKYIEFELKNPIAAYNTVQKIIETYESLADFPDLGIKVDKYVNFSTDYRFILANNYSIFYRTDNNDVKIIRILYARSDFIKVLFNKQ